MRILGLIITRQKTARVGSFESAIIDLQERVAALEQRRAFQSKEAKIEEVAQTEIDKILATGNPPGASGDLWSRLP